MAEDLRTRLTRKMIRDSFVELLEQHPLDKVTVAAICAKAEINRATFYRYYDNPLDLYDRVEEEFFAALRGKIREAISAADADGAFQGAISASLRFFKDNERQLLAMRKHGKAADFNKKVLEETFEDLTETAELSYRGLSPKGNSRFRAYTGYGSAMIVEAWLEGGMKDDPGDLASFLAACAKGAHDALTLGAQPL